MAAARCGLVSPTRLGLPSRDHVLARVQERMHDINKPEARPHGATRQHDAVRQVDRRVQEHLTAHLLHDPAAAHEAARAHRDVHDLLQRQSQRVLVVIAGGGRDASEHWGHWTRAARGTRRRRRRHVPRKLHRPRVLRRVVRNIGVREQWLRGRLGRVGDHKVLGRALLRREERGVVHVHHFVVHELKEQGARDCERHDRRYAVSSDDDERAEDNGEHGIRRVLEKAQLPRERVRERRVLAEHHRVAQSLQLPVALLLRDREHGVAVVVRDQRDDGEHFHRVHVRGSGKVERARLAQRDTEIPDEVEAQQWDDPDTHCSQPCVRFPSLELRGVPDRDARWDRHPGQQVGKQCQEKHGFAAKQRRHQHGLVLAGGEAGLGRVRR